MNHNVIKRTYIRVENRFLRRGQGAAMNERRRIARQKSFLQGRVFFNNRRTSVDCLIRDFSELGARLKFSGAVATPEVIELHIPNKDETYRARVQWRNGDEMGVSFDNYGAGTEA